MGALASLFKRIIGKGDIRILMAGLVGAGKTTIMYKLKLGEITKTDSGGDTIEYKNIKFTALDVGVPDESNLLWKNDLQKTRAVVCVVDSNDRESIGEARRELNRILAEDELRDAVLLVFANKQYLPNAMNATEIRVKLGFHSLRNRSWYIQATCATSGDGLYEGLD